MLYTREFFEAVKAHLNPGGVVTLFVQLYESNTAAVKSEIGDVLRGVPERRDLGQHEQRPGLRPRAARARSSRSGSTSTRSRRGSAPEYAPVAKSLREIGFYSAVDLFSSYAGRATDLKEWLKDAHDQPRPQPAPAVPGRPRPQPLRERPDLFRDSPLPQVPRGHVRRLAGNHRLAPRRDPARPRLQGIGNRFTVQGSRFGFRFEVLTAQPLHNRTLNLEP